MNVTFERLPGLPGTGPLPLHYYRDQPTPWREGFVIRFSNERGDTWVGNFQGGDGYYGGIEPEIESWPEASQFVLIVAGACYLVSTTEIGRCVCHQSTAAGLLFNESRSRLFVADCHDIYSYDRRGKVAWRRRELAADGIVLYRCIAGILEGEACQDPTEDVWRPFRISERDGADV